MSTQTQFVQCRLTRMEGTSRYETVSWLPAKVKSSTEGKHTLRVGSVVDLKRDDGTWDRDWVVQSMGHPAEAPPDWRGSIKSHRNQTGDNLPKRKGLDIHN